MTKMFWYNFDTDDYDFIETPDDFSSYVPKGAARNLYHLYIERLDLSPLKAANKVLSACVGEGE